MSLPLPVSVKPWRNQNLLAAGFIPGNLPLGRVLRSHNSMNTSGTSAGGLGYSVGIRCRPSSR
jgi:hypothetical protein